MERNSFAIDLTSVDTDMYVFFLLELFLFNETFKLQTTIS